MLSTTQTLECPTCGLPATVRVHTLRHRRVTNRDAFEPQLSFSCRRGCALDTATIRRLCGMDDAAA